MAASDPRPIRQPLPFSHRQHAAASCDVCHSKAATGERAGLPGTAQCMLCHDNLKKDKPALRLLDGYHKENKPIPWERVYQIPDFVFFSHAKHASAKVGCAACHGPVERRDVLAREVPANMKACMACHAERGASNACNVCHELGQ